MALKVRKGYGPHQPQQMVPGIYLNPRVDPDAFGAGLGRGLQKFAAGIEARQSQLSDFTTKKAYIEEATALQSDFATRMTEAPLGAEGFTQQTLTDYTARHNTILDNMRKQGLPEDQVQELDLRFSSLRQGVAGQSLNFQEESYYSKVGQDVDDMGANLSRMTLADPDLVEDADRELRVAVDAIPGLDAMAREKLYQDNVQLLNVSAGLGLAEKDPLRVMRLLNPQDEGVQGFIQKMKGNVAKVESGHTDDPYRALGPTIQRKFGPDKAHGKYQVMGANIPEWTKQAIGRSVDTQTFLNSPEIQEAVFEDQMARLYEKHGGSVRDAASVWFTGTTYDKAVAKGRHDGNLSVQEYVARVEGGPSTGLGTVGGDVGDPVLDRLSASERLRVLSAAQTSINRQQAEARAQLEVMEKNATAAFLVGEEYTGSPLSEQMFEDAYGPLQGQQRWSAFAGRARVGEFITGMGTLSEEQISQRVNSIRPPDPASPTFAEEQVTYLNARDAGLKVIKDRTEDSAGYVLRNYPAVQEATAKAVESKLPADRQLVYAEMQEAYDQLGIHPTDRKAFPEALLKDVQYRLQTASPEQKVEELVMMRAELGDLFYTGLEQLEKSGLPNEAYVAGLVGASPEHKLIAADALRGLQMMKENEALRPNEAQVTMQFSSTMGAAQRNLPGKTAQSIRELATGLYVVSGGAPDLSDTDLFDQSVRQVLGGAGGENTGIYDFNSFGSDTNLKTILPPNVTADEFETWVESATTEVWMELGGLPRDIQDNEVTPAEIAREGTFVRVGAEDYRIVMQSDGLQLQRGGGEPYTVRLTSELIKSRRPSVSVGELPFITLPPATFGVSP